MAHMQTTIEQSPPQSAHLSSTPTFDSISPDAVVRDEPRLAGSALSLPERMISACSGALLVTLLVTPFDVVKTRMQAGTPFPRKPLVNSRSLFIQPQWQHKSPISSRSRPSSTSTPRSSWVCNSTLYPAFHRSRSAVSCNAVKDLCHYNEADGACRTARGVSGMTGSSAGSGMCRSRDIMGQPIRTSVYKGTWDGVRQIMHNEGVRGLWRGVAPALIMQIPATVIYYVGYEHFRDALNGWLSPSYAPLSPLLAGSVARTIATSLVSPVELIKTRIQSTSSVSTSSSAWLEVSAIIRSAGWRSLWKGVGPTLWRDVPFSGIYWIGYERLKVLFTDAVLQARRTDPTLSSAERLSTSFLAGSLAGSFAALCTNPFDVAKTLQQTALAESRHEKSETSNRGLLQKPSGLGQALVGVIQRDGWQGLFRGLSPRVARVAPACGVMISSYELGKKFFESR
ncbi:mitochondrial carrier domain-containing protein [Zopfochytrium polystomum]|nr:mitochondrial carrier domain-containing protein [Zopfochytrium polystomum]